jgi:hypothetical protein
MTKENVPYAVRLSAALVCAAALTVLIASNAFGQVSSQATWCMPQQTEPSQHTLALVACMPTAQIEPGAPITVFVALANMSRNPVLVRARLDLGTYLQAIVTDKDGGNVRLQVLEPGYVGPDSTDVVLPPGGLVGRRLNLRCDPGAYRPQGSPCWVQLSIQKPGEYRLRFLYDNRCPITGCPEHYPWVGQIQSPVLQFRILGGRDSD